MKNPSPASESRWTWAGQETRRAGCVAAGELLLRTFVRSADARGADEELLAVRERDVTPVGAQRAVLGLEALDEDLRAGQQRVLVPAAAQERVRRAALDHPLLDLAVGSLDVDVDPGVRIDPLHLRDGAPQLYRLLRVEFSRKRVVRNHRHCGNGHRERDPRHNAKQSASHRIHLLPKPRTHWQYSTRLPVRLPHFCHTVGGICPRGRLLRPGYWAFRP